MTGTSASFYVTGGTLRTDAPSYVERQADSDLYEGLSRGEFCYVLTSRQMGKSSLMVRTAARLRGEGVQVAVLDLTAIGQNLSPEQWYGGLLRRLGRQLDPSGDLEEKLDDFWSDEEKLGPLQRWMAALEQVVLPRLGIGSQVLGIGTDLAAQPPPPPTPNTQHPTPRLVIFLDEIDAVRSLPFSTDEFFAGIRECYNRRTEDTQFRSLTFCLLGVATPSDLIQDVRVTPFNIGTRIELSDFSEAEAAPLTQGLARNGAGAALLKRVLYWTGGHPYLTQRLCQAVAQDTSVTSAGGVDRLCEALFLSKSARDKDDNLLFVRERILRNEGEVAGLLELYRQVRDGKRVAADDTNQLVGILRLAGITRLVEGYLLVRNRIYYRVFDREWVVAHMPDAEVRRQRAAFRRGLTRASAVGGVIVAVMAGLALTAASQAHIAQEALRQTDINAGRLKLSLTKRDQANQRLQVALRTAEEARQTAQREAVRANRNEHVARDRAVEARQSAAAAREAAHRAEVQQRRAESATVQEAAQRQRAEDQEQRAQAAAGRARVAATREKAQRVAVQRTLYGVRMNLAQQAWKEAFMQQARDLLHAQQPRAGEEDLRGFDWRYLWRLCRGDQRATLPGQVGNFASAALSPGGAMLATASSDGAVQVVETASRRTVALIKGTGTGNQPFAFSPDGRLLAGVSADQTARMWDLATQREIAAFPDRPGDAHSVAFSPDSRTLAIGTREGAIHLWDVASRSDRGLLKGHTSAIHAVVFSPDGRTLASASDDRTVRLWRVPSQAARGNQGNGEAFQILRGHALKVWAVAFSADGRLLATGGTDDLVKLWDAATGRELATLSGHTDVILGLAFSPDSQTLASSAADTTVRLWQVATRQEIAVLRGHTHWIFSVEFSPDGKMVVSSSGDGTVRVWDAPPTPAVPVLAGHTNTIRTVTFAPDGKTLASVDQGGTVKLWDTRTQREQATFALPPAAGRTIGFTPEGKLLAVSAVDAAVRLWDVAAGREWALLPGAHGAIRSVALSPDGRVLAAASADGTVSLWTLPSRERRVTLPGHRGIVPGLLFAQGGKYLLSAGSGVPVRVWEVATGKERLSLALTNVGRFGPWQVSPDGRTLVVVQGNQGIQVALFDLRTGRQVATLQGHRGSILSLAFTPDGKLLATGSGDNSVKLWNVASGQEVATLRAHTDGVTAMAFSPDGRILATGSLDETVRLWQAATPEEVSAGEAEDRAEAERQAAEQARAAAEAAALVARGSIRAGVIVSGNLLVNGSFEQGPKVGEFLNLVQGSTALTGWTVSRGSVDLIGSDLQSSRGKRCLDLNGQGVGGIEQTFATVPGQTYRVTFDLAGQPFGVTLKQLRVSAAGQSAEFAFDITNRTPAAMGWIGKHWEFTATDTRTTLEFYTISPTGPNGPVLDNVAVVPVTGQTDGRPAIRRSTPEPRWPP